MRVEGDKKLIRQLKALPAAERKHVQGVIRRATNEGARVARALAPNVTGETRAGIDAFVIEDGMKGIVSGMPSRALADRVYSIEHGRKKGNRGTTIGFKFMWRAKQFVAKRFRARVRNALRRAAREAVRNG